MSKRFALFMAIFLALFGSLNYYVGVRGWQWVGRVAPGQMPASVYGAGFALIAFSFPLARVGRRFLPRRLTDLLSVVGGFWFLVLFYSLPLLGLIDLGRLLNAAFHFVPAGGETAVAKWLGGLVVLTLTGLLVYGTWRARRPVLVRYDISVPKSGRKHNELHVVLVSDTHLGAINGSGRLRAMVDMVNNLQPDLVLLGGDLIDDDFGPFVAHDMATELQKLGAPLGVYSILGNHDFPAGHSADFRREMERAGVHLLVDETVTVDESLCIIGRDDISGRRHSGRTRKEMHELMQGVDHSLPLILMDHQPFRLEEAQEAGIDLQVSGHTHRGQMFPNNLITRRVFELDWGYLQKGTTHVIVSLGFGTWGPPVRIGNRPELVSIRVHFQGI